MYLNTMSSFLRVVIFWIILTVTIQTVYTDDHNDNVGGNVDIVVKPFVNFSALSTLMTSPTYIIIGGNKIFSADWYPRIENKVDNLDNGRLIEAFTFIKCKCASYLVETTTVIYFLLKFCPLGGQRREDSDYLSACNCSLGVDLLVKLDEILSRAITTIFEIAHRHQNLKSQEQYFLKTLLLAYMYVNRFNDTERQAKNFEYILAQYDVDRDRQAEFVKMRRVVLQITNLIYGFAIEYCNSDSINVYEKKLGTTEITRLRSGKDIWSDLNVLLKNVVSLDDDGPLHSLIGMDDIKLRKCIHEDALMEHDDKYVQFCSLYLRKSSVKTTGDVGGFLAIPELFKNVEHSYRLESVYEYMSAIYKVTWKSILRATAEHWTASDDPSDVEECEGITEKLQSLDFPTEIIDHFELVCKLQNYRNASKIQLSDAREIAENKFKTNPLTDVSLPEMVAKHLSLSDLMNVILDIRLRKFWLVFNLLYKVSEKNSRSVYDLSLDLDVKNIHNPSSDNRIKCNKLTDIYFNFFAIQSKYFDCFYIHDENSKIDCYENVRSMYELFLNMLLDIYDKWDLIDYLRGDSDLRKIILVTIIHLKNVLYTNVDEEFIKNGSEMADLYDRRMEILERRENFIMNVLDNYQIRQCTEIKNRFYVYAVEYNISKFKNLRTLNNSSIISTKNKNSLEKAFDVIKNVNENLGCSGCSKTTDNQVSEDDKINEDKTVLYSISQLTGKDSIKNIDLLANGTYFNWHGESKSISDIQIDITENMLHFYDLVEYENLFVQWTFYVFYSFWFEATKEMYNHSNTDKKLILSAEDENWGEGIKCILQLNVELNAYQKYYQYKKYADFCQEKIFFFNKLCKNDTKCNDSRVLEMLKKEILDPMANLLGIVDVKISDINCIQGISEYNNKLSFSERFSIIRSFIKTIFSMVDKQFIYLDRDLHIQ